MPTHRIDDKHLITCPHCGEPTYLIENLDNKAIDRFRKQIETINLIGVKNKEDIDKSIENCILKSPKTFGEPYIAIKIVPEIKISLNDKRALHSKIVMDYLGRIKKRGE